MNKPATAKNPAATTGNQDAPGTEQSDKPMPKLGEIVHVVVAEGVVLRNNETGAPFVPGEPTPQTVNLTVLRRLQDGDFRLV